MSAVNKHLKLTFEPEGKNFVVDADTSKLRQVVANLIDNSIKYTDKGFVKVALHKKAGDIIFDVTDSGIGIDPGDMGRLFQKFARGSLTLTTTGNGLGLFVGKKIIDAHKGTIGAESKGKGFGSRFYFTLPESTGTPTVATSFADNQAAAKKLVETKAAQARAEETRKDTVKILENK